MATPVILVVEDDTAIRRGLVDALKYAGYAMLEAADGATAIEIGLESPVDLVLLDVMLPAVDGFAVLEQLRQARPTLPVIMVTARGAEEDRIRGLRDGADDYIVKPFSAKELIARVEAVLRRSPERPTDLHALITDGMTIDLDRREIVRDGQASQQLSEREAAILRYLAVNHDRTVDRDELLHRVWGLNPKGIQTRTVDMHVARLREKLGGNGTGGQIILTVRSKGYMLADSVRIEER